ncbi:MAG: DUF1013 domain-containing protein [Neomegalonema sp.]|nr:DUF1013 domain-containing protein [Neomegalonema sp.]
MPKATAVWLVDHTTLTFDQIAEFVGLHPLEISGIADGEVAAGIKGFDPIANNQLTREEIERCEKNPKARLKLRPPAKAPQQKKKAPRYTPLSKRQERPAAIAWLVRYHPELADAQICKLLGTTKQTIEAIRNKTHWNSSGIQPVDPVALGLCRQTDLDAAVAIASEKRAEIAAAAPRPDLGDALMSVETSLTSDPRFEGADQPTESAGFEQPNPFGDTDPPARSESEEGPSVDPEALFNLPAAEEEKEEEAPQDPFKS